MGLSSGPKQPPPPPASVYKGERRRRRDYLSRRGTCGPSGHLGGGYQTPGREVLSLQRGGGALLW